MTGDPVAESVAFLEAVPEGRAWDERALADVAETRLESALSRDAASIAFWLNVYNAATQLALVDDASLYDRRRFVRTPLVTVAGHDLALDGIEHGVLRRGRLKYGLGYLGHPLWGGFEAAVAPDAVDPRIHFALNCGAASCPAIRAYGPETVDDQLDRAARGYLARTVEYDPEAGRVVVPRVFLWFRGDFGGRSGILAFLRRYDVLGPEARPRLSHRRWDWSPSPGDFADAD